MAEEPVGHSAAEIARKVSARDEERCAFISSTGKRCDSTFQLEFHHVVPFALGGRATVNDIALRCRVHNDHQARIDFGDHHMDNFSRKPSASR